MRLLLLTVVASLLAATAAPSFAATALDSTGTVYSTDRVVVPMVFPVVGPTSFTDTFLACRSGCSRKHMGQDLMGAKMSPVLAAFNGTVSSLKRETSPGGGNYVVLTGDNGWSAVYIHVNNDMPGTDDGRGTALFAFPKGIEVGVRVLAGQLIAWRGDSGSAESTGPHVHFELRKGSGWSGTVYNAYASLVAARRLSVALASGPHPDQSLLRSTTGAMFVTEGAIKHPVSRGVLTANGLNFGSAVTVSAAECLLYKTGPALALRDGALVRDPDGAVWRILAGTRYPVTPSEGQRVTAVAATDLLGLTTVEPPPLPTAGMLVRHESNVYAVQADGALRQVTSTTMASWGWTNADVVEDSGLVQPIIALPLGLRDATLINVSGLGAAVVSGGILLRLWDLRELTAYGYAGKPRLNVPAALVAGWPSGEIADPAYGDYVGR